MSDIYYKVVNGQRLSFFANSLYCLNYKLQKGCDKKIVKAIKDTVGIMAFDSLKNAKKFVFDYSQKTSQILKVKAVGKPKKPPENICCFADRGFIDEFYSGWQPELGCQAPKGTVFFDAVEIIKDDVVFRRNC